MKKILAGLFSLWACAAQAQIVGTLPFQLQNGTTADATQVMADFNKILNDVNINGAKNGVNNDITALNALVTPLTPAQGGSSVYFASTSGGTANAQTVATPAPIGFTLATGKRVTFIAGFTNTAAAQLNVNGTGLVNVFRPTPSGPVALVSGEIVAGNYIEVVYDGTQYQLYTNAVQQSFGVLTNLASAATTDLGTIGSHNINITGTTGITAFGSAAITGWPVYKLTFAGILTLTHNGTSLILPGGQGITTAANDTAEAVYLGSGNWRIDRYTRGTGVANVSATLIQNYISGYQLGTAGSSATFSISSGSATDSTNAATMVLASNYTKTTSSWVVGTGVGALDTGAIAINTWYHVFAIQRPDTGAVDVCFSASFTGCAGGVGSIPAAYTLKRRVGAIRTNASSQWRLFRQFGNEFLWDVPSGDLTSFALTASATSVTLLVPSGLTVLARFSTEYTSTALSSGFVVFSPLVSTQAVESPVGNASGFTQAVNATSAGSAHAIFTDTTSKIVAVSNGAGTIAFSVATLGWRDDRGQQ